MWPFRFVFFGAANSSVGDKLKNAQSEIICSAVWENNFVMQIIWQSPKYENKHRFWVQDVCVRVSASICV